MQKFIFFFLMLVLLGLTYVSGQGEEGKEKQEETNQEKGGDENKDEKS